MSIVFLVTGGGVIVAMKSRLLLQVSKPVEVHRVRMLSDNMGFDGCIVAAVYDSD